MKTEEKDVLRHPGGKLFTKCFSVVTGFRKQISLTKRESEKSWGVEVARWVHVYLIVSPVLLLPQLM